jgi:hypothetical protein
MSGDSSAREKSDGEYGKVAGKSDFSKVVMGSAATKRGCRLCVEMQRLALQRVAEPPNQEGPAMRRNMGLPGIYGSQLKEK